MDGNPSIVSSPYHFSPLSLSFFQQLYRDKKKRTTHQQAGRFELFACLFHNDNDTKGDTKDTLIIHSGMNMQLSREGGVEWQTKKRKKKRKEKKSGIRMRISTRRKVVALIFLYRM